jgi:hypothetical protein
MASKNNMEKEKIYLEVGECAIVEMPYSEVCMHMKVAGKKMIVERLSNMAQLYSLGSKNGCPSRDKPFSFPITYGEAGLFRGTNDSRVVYTYGEKL